MKTNTPEEEALNGSNQNNNVDFNDGYTPISINPLDDDGPKKENTVNEEQSALPAATESIIEESSYERLSNMVSSLRDKTHEESPSIDQSSTENTETVRETPPIVPPPFTQATATPPPPPTFQAIPQTESSPSTNTALENNDKKEKETISKSTVAEPAEPKPIPIKKKKSGGNKTILYIIFGLLALGLIGGGVLFLTRDDSAAPNTQTEISETTEVNELDGIVELPETIEVEVEETTPLEEIEEEIIVVEELKIEELAQKQEESAKPKAEEAKSETPKKTEQPKPAKTEPTASKSQPVKENVVYPLHTTIKYPAGNVYTGYINAAGKKEGQGTYTFASGDKYVGNWINDQATGQGTYYSREGWKYVGNFVNLKFHGQGVWHFADGKTKKGVWENGVIKK